MREHCTYTTGAGATARFTCGLPCLHRSSTYALFPTTTTPLWRNLSRLEGALQRHRGTDSRGFANHKPPCLLDQHRTHPPKPAGVLGGRRSKPLELPGPRHRNNTTQQEGAQREHPLPCHHYDITTIGPCLPLIMLELCTFAVLASDHARTLHICRACPGPMLPPCT